MLKKQQVEEAQRLQKEAKDVMQQRVEKELRQEASKKAKLDNYNKEVDRKAEYFDKTVNKPYADMLR